MSIRRKCELDEVLLFGIELIPLCSSNAKIPECTEVCVCDGKADEVDVDEGFERLSTNIRIASMCAAYF